MKDLCKIIKGPRLDAAEATETIQFVVRNVVARSSAPNLLENNSVYTAGCDVAVGVGTYAVTRGKDDIGFLVYKIHGYSEYGHGYADLESVDAEELPVEFQDQVGPGVDDEFGSRSGLLQQMALETAVRLAVHLEAERAMGDAFEAAYEQEADRAMRAAERIERDFTYEVEGGEGEVESSIYEVSVTLNGLGEIEEYEAFPYDDVGGLLSNSVKFNEEEERRLAAWVLDQLQGEDEKRHDKQMEGPQK